MSARKVTDRTYASQVDVKTPTPGVYQRGSKYRVLTRPDGSRKVMRTFATYEEAVAFKSSTPSRGSYEYSGRYRRGNLATAYEAVLRGDPCAYCGGPSDVYDHIEPRAGGGADDWSNLTAACRACNARKYDKPLLIFLAQLNGCWEWKQIRS